MKCLLCKKELNITDYGPEKGGELTAAFGYGSTHDQIGYKGEDKNTRLKILLQSDFIRAYICDECFEQNVDLFEGFEKLHHPVEYIKITE